MSAVTDYLKMVIINYLYCTVFLFIGAQCAIISDYNRLMQKVITTATICADQTKNRVDPDFCMSQWDGKHDPQEKMFDDCKEIMTCAVKKMGFMTPEGHWDEEKILSLKDGIKNEGMLADFDKTYSDCKAVEGSNGDAVVNMMQCLMKSSDRVKQSIKGITDSLTPGDYW